MTSRLSDAAKAPGLGAPTLTSDERRLNLALNLAYLGAQYHGRAVGGGGLSSAMITGIGRPGVVLGSRGVAFADPTIAATAADLAADKADQVASLRLRLGGAAAAMPVLDLSPSVDGAFTRTARAAGLVSSAAFDPYASDGNYLLGAFMIEDGVAATLRGMSVTAPDAVSSPLDDDLAHAIYTGGLVRALLDQQAAADPALGENLTRLCAALARFDGSDVGDQAMTNAGSGSANLTDAAGRPIPFMRSTDQTLRLMMLCAGARGGFLPYGANGLT